MHIYFVLLGLVLSVPFLVIDWEDWCTFYCEQDIKTFTQSISPAKNLPPIIAKVFVLKVPTQPGGTPEKKAGQTMAEFVCCQLMYPDRVEGLMLVNCTASQAGWVEWGYQKVIH